MNKAPLGVLTLVCFAAVAEAAPPLPVGVADVTFSYPTTGGGMQTLQGQFDYSGQGPGDADPLGGDPNITYFNSVNSFGRRTQVPGAIGPDESLLTHAFFKPAPFTTNFFQDIAPGADVTLTVQNIQFAEPVFVQTDTVLLHRLWDADQLDAVDLANQPFFHHHAHNHPTSDPFRDFDLFFPPNAQVFHDHPPDYEIGALSGANALQVFGDGTGTIGFSITVPYDSFQHIEEDPDNPLDIPAGLPAPYGFLEPFHFHVEFVVSQVPEPAAIGPLVFCAVWLTSRRKKSRR